MYVHGLFIMLIKDTVSAVSVHNKCMFIAVVLLMYSGACLIRSSRLHGLAGTSKTGVVHGE